MKKLIIVILFIGGIIGLQYIPNNTEVVNQPTTETKKSDLEEIYNEASFKKQMELKARTVKATRAKEAELSRHKESLAKIEAELESVRKEEIALGSESFQ